MSETTKAFLSPPAAAAAHDVVIEFIKVGKISSAKDATDVFSTMLNHYRAELKRIKKESEAR